MPELTYWMAQHGDEQVTMLSSGDDECDSNLIRNFVFKLGWPHDADLSIKKMVSGTAYGSIPYGNGKDMFRYHNRAQS